MAITKNTTLEEIDKIVENFVHEDLTSREQFSLDVIKFINLNNQYYWFLLSVNNSLVNINFGVSRSFIGKTSTKNNSEIW